MNVNEIFKLAQESQPKPANLRLEQTIKFLERDINRAAHNGKYYLKVDFSEKIISEELIFQIQDYFMGAGFTIKTLEDKTKYREFTISWDLTDNAE